MFRILTNSMRAIIDSLFKAQNLLRDKDSATEAKRAATLQKLRETVPAPMLAHYLRLLGIGRNSVALVRRGICSECHIRIPVSTIGSLMKPTDIQVCESCGCYLLLPEDENPLAAQPAKPVAAARRRVRRETAAAT